MYVLMFVCMYEPTFEGTVCKYACDSAYTYTQYVYIEFWGLIPNQRQPNFVLLLSPGLLLLLDFFFL